MYFWLCRWVGDPASISGEVGSPLPGLYRASGEGAFTHESGATAGAEGAEKADPERVECQASFGYRGLSSAWALSPRLFIFVPSGDGGLQNRLVGRAEAGSSEHAHDCLHFRLQAETFKVDGRAMGKGDQRTRRGKINRGTFGRSRPRKRKQARKVTAPKS